MGNGHQEHEFESRGANESRAEELYDTLEVCLEETRGLASQVLYEFGEQIEVIHEGETEDEPIVLKVNYLGTLHLIDEDLREDGRYERPEKQVLLLQEVTGDEVDYRLVVKYDAFEDDGDPKTSYDYIVDYTLGQSGGIILDASTIDMDSDQEVVTITEDLTVDLPESDTDGFYTDEGQLEFAISAARDMWEILHELDETNKRRLLNL